MLLTMIGEANATSEPKLTNDLDCLATNSYFEAKNQSLAGQLAVVLVVFNRVESEHFPNEVCEVILQGPVKESWKTKKDPSLDDSERIYYPIRHRCQFSWYCDGMRDTIKDEVAYEKIKESIRSFLKSDMFDFTEGSTHYHANYVSPDWAEEKKITTVIDDHIFYR